MCTILPINISSSWSFLVFASLASCLIAQTEWVYLTAFTGPFAAVLVICAPFCLLSAQANCLCVLRNLGDWEKSTKYKFELELASLTLLFHCCLLVCLCVLKQSLLFGERKQQQIQSWFFVSWCVSLLKRVFFNLKCWTFEMKISYNKWGNKVNSAQIFVGGTCKSVKLAANEERGKRQWSIECADLLCALIMVIPTFANCTLQQKQSGHGDH